MLNLSLGLMQPTTFIGSAIQNLTMTGLTDGAAVMGDHAGISVGFPSGVTSWTSQAWGTSYGDTTYGTGANPTTFTSGTDGTLFWEGVGDDAETYRAAAPIRFALATAADALGPYSWTVDDTVVNVDFTSDFTANGNSLTYVVTGLPAGVSDDGDGSASGTPTAAASGGITINATDEYGRVATSTPTFTAALRAQATVAGGLGPFSFTEDVAIASQNLAADFTVNGNTVSYAMTSALPAGLSLSSAGVLSGTPTTLTGSASYTVRATDEYGRITDSTFSLAVVAAGVTLTLNSITLTDGSGGTPPSVTVDDTYSGSDNLDLVLSLSSSATAPSKAQIDAGTGGGVLETATIQLGVGSVTLEDAYTSATDGATHAHGYLVERTNSAVFSGIESDAFGEPVDATDPTLTSFTAASGDAQGTISYATSEDNGTVYFLTQPAATAAPTFDAIVSGADSSVSITASGAQTDVTVGSLTNGTAYTTYAAYIDDWGNDSPVYDADYTPALPAAGPTFISGTNQADDLNGSAATITSGFPAAGTYVVGVGDTPQNTNTITYAISGPNVTSATLLADSTAEIATDRTNAYMFLVTTSAASDLTITAGGTGNSFERSILIWEAPGRTATGAITGVAKVSNVATADITATALNVPADHHVFAIYSNRTGSTTGVTWSGSFVDADEDYDAAGAGAANRHAGASLATTALGTITATATGTADDLDNSQSSAVIVALGAA